MYLQLPLQQWGAVNVSLLVLVLSSWKVTIVENPRCNGVVDTFGHELHSQWSNFLKDPYFSRTPLIQNNLVLGFTRDFLYTTFKKSVC